MKDKFKHKYTEISNFILDNLKGNFHHKTVLSISNSVFGLLNSGKATISKIGYGYAKGNNKTRKHGIKQTDKLLSNKKFDIQKIQKTITRLTTINRKDIIIAIDWTYFYKDNQATITAKIITNHGRATPLCWLTVYLDDLKGNMFKYENTLLENVYNNLPKDSKVTILADRGFGSKDRLKQLKNVYKFDYVVRFKKNNYVSFKGRDKKASRWLSSTYTSRKLKNAYITKDKLHVPLVAIIKDKGMKDYWCLACSNDKACIKTIKKYYAKRWSTETSYRDEKNDYFGLGLYKSRIKNKHRRDRLFAIISLAIIVLTLLGDISEKLKLNKHIKANTTKYRTHSLFTQGLIVFEMLYSFGSKTRTKIMALFEKNSTKAMNFTGVYGCV